MSAAIKSINSARRLGGPSTHRLPSVLRLVLGTGHTSAPYHQFTLAGRPWYETTLCSFYPTGEPSPAGVDVHSGPGRIGAFLGMVRNLTRRGSFDVVHCHTPHVAAMYVAAVRRRHRPPIVITVHCAYSNFKWRNRFLLATAMTGLDHVVYCSRSSLDSTPRWLRSQVPHSVIPNGVDCARIDRAIASLPRRDSANFEIVSVGRLIDSKSPLTLVRAASLLGGPDVRLTFVGDGPLSDVVMRESRRLGMAGRVSVTGTLPREQVFQRLVRADLFVSASAREGLPVAVLEAMACGCPVVLSDIPPHREIMAERPEWNGFALRDFEALAHRIHTFRKLDGSDRAALGRAGADRIRRIFSLDEMHRQYQQLFGRLMR